MSYALMQRSAKTSASLRRGFTLTEAAIVLGLMGVVVGAIFAALPSVYRRHQLEVAVNQVWQIAGNVRSIYTGRSNVNYPDTVAEQVAASLYPQDMLSGGNPVGPWNSAVSISFPARIAGQAQLFDINFIVIDNAQCIEFLKHFAPLATGNLVNNNPSQQDAPASVAWFEGATVNQLAVGVSPTAIITAMNNKTCTKVGFLFAL